MMEKVIYFTYLLIHPYSFLDIVWNIINTNNSMSTKDDYVKMRGYEYGSIDEGAHHLAPD